MLQDCDQFELALLEVVFNDLEPFESIESKLSPQQTASGETFDIRTILLRSITDDLVGAYLLHAEHPYVTAVEAHPDTIHRYWYCITSRGKRRLQNLREKDSRIHFERSA
jgi:hypothetical protein